ncbi:MAG: CDP-alcohol phosphatidyltransferase family protein [Deltaproteobacteria bacterium]|nr:CDP-alcohol phosphatidyltransferase family protein [Deltaproteobacteria bacterium]
MSAAHVTAKKQILDERFDVAVSRPTARWMARYFHRFGFSADQVSLIAMGCGVLAGVLFTSSGLWPVLGGLLLVAMVVIDCADGEVARMGPPSDKPWRGRMFDGIADLGTVLSVHIAMVIVLANAHIDIGGHILTPFECFLLVVLGFASFSWKSSVVDDIKQRLKPSSVDRDLTRYADQKKTLFERFLYRLLVDYVKTAAKLTGSGRPGGYDVFRQVALVGPTHHLVAMAIAGACTPFAPTMFLTYLLITIVPGNLYLWAVLARARRAEI